MGVLSLVVVVLTAMMLSLQLRRVITHRALLNARQSAEVDMQLAVGLFFPPAPLDGDRVALGSQGATGGSLFSNPVVRKRVLSATAWTLDGKVAYSTERGAIGTTEVLPATARRAASGTALATVAEASRVRNDNFTEDLLQGSSKVLVVDMPFSLTGSGPPQVVIEFTQPYAPIAAAVRHDTLMVFGWLAGGLLLLYLGLFRLVAAASQTMRRQSEVNRHLAMHDSLTGLANRGLLTNRVAKALAAAAKQGRTVALLLMDLDHFKEINDTLGHHHGDELLRLVGPRLRQELREGDTVARLGGDEFVVLLPDAGDEAGALAVADRLRAALSQPFDVEGVSLDVGSSIGLAVTSGDGDTVQGLLRHADVAMYAAKSSGLGVRVYEPAQEVDRARARLGS